MESDDRMIDCHSLMFSSELAAERIAKAECLFGWSALRRILCFALYLLGVNRRAIAEVLGLPFESLKTTIRVLHRDGLPAFEDRRQVASTFMAPPSTSPEVNVQEDSGFVVIEFGQNKCMRIPCNNTVQIKTLILSLVNDRLISAKTAGDILRLTSAYVRDLAKQLEQKDVSAALLDKRQGQMQQYRMTPETTALLIQQFAAHAVTGKSTSSIVLADELNVPDRTIRVYAGKLGFSTIAKSLPELVGRLKKNSSQ